MREPSIQHISDTARWAAVFRARESERPKALPREEAGWFAQDLRSLPAFQRWALDILSPPLLKMLQKKTHQQFGSERSLLRSAPEEGPAFYAGCSWRVRELHSVRKT